MKHIETIETRDLCQSACKTSCGIANQACEKKNND